MTCKHITAYANEADAIPCPVCENKQLRQQLLSALAAIAEHNRRMEEDCADEPIEINLSLLQQHDAEIETRAYAKGAQDQHGEDELVRKPLVEALGYYAEMGDNCKIAKDALAKVAK